MQTNVFLNAPFFFFSELCLFFVFFFLLHLMCATFCHFPLIYILAMAQEGAVTEAGKMTKNK